MFISNGIIYLYNITNQSEIRIETIIVFELNWFPLIVSESGSFI